jgi:hypothetical protein
VARIVMSSLVSDIRGLLGNYVYSFQRGVHYIKLHNPNPNYPNSEPQQYFKGCFSDLGTIWHNLPSVNKEMWQRFGSLQKKPISAYAAFIRMNMILLCSRHVDLVYSPFPPLTPSRPLFVYGIAASSVDSVSNIITWSRPLTNSDYVQVAQRLDDNALPGYSMYWSMVQTVRSDVGEIIHNHNYPIGTKVHYRARSLDTWGRTAPNTHVLTVVVPS